MSRPPVTPTSAPLVGIMGVPVSSGNRGVQALGESLVRLCREALPGARVKVFGADRSGLPVTMHPEGQPLSVEQVHWRMSPKGGWRHHLLVLFGASLLYRWGLGRGWLRRTFPWLDQVASTRLIGDVRGGDSFSDIYGMGRFLVSSLPIYSVLWVRGQLVQFPQTYGPYHSRLARWIARDILLRSSLIVARDLRSQKVAQELVGGRREVRLSPDVAFALHVRAPAQLLLDGRAVERLRPGTLGFNVNGLMYYGGYTRANQFGLRMDYAAFLPRVIEALLRESDADLVLVPHTLAPAGDLESDNEASRLVREALPAELRSRVHLVTGDYDAHEMKSVIGQCDFFVGSRMHSCIGALSQGIPCVGVAYSMKFAGVFESVGYGQGVIDARDVDTDEAVARVLRAFREREAGRQALQSRALAAREELKTVFRDLFASTQPPAV